MGFCCIWVVVFPKELKIVFLQNGFVFFVLLCMWVILLLKFWFVLGFILIKLRLCFFQLILIVIYEIVWFRVFVFDRFYYVYLNTVLVKWLRLFFSKLDVAMYWVWADFLTVCSFLDFNFFGPLSVWYLACDLIVLLAFVFWFVLISLESVLVWYYFLLLLLIFIGPVWLIECLNQEIYCTPNVFWSLRDTSVITLVCFWVYDPGEAVVFVEVHI